MDLSKAQPDLTTLLHEWRNGNAGAFSVVINELYAELKAVAARQLARRRGAQTITATELLNEALLGIMNARPDFENRGHFLATMSLATRAVLVDHARAQSSRKRGGDQVQVTFTEGLQGEAPMVLDLLALDQALDQLEELDPRCGKVLHLAFFAGMSRDDIADVLEVSPATVRRDLRFGRAWIEKALSP
ncbi:MAG TPA: ECF-type sigma factor [Povalibacter sp.]